MKINELIQSFEVWTTNEERELLKKLSSPVKLSSLSENDQFKVEVMIRKTIVTGKQQSPFLAFIILSTRML